MKVVGTSGGPFTLTVSTGFDRGWSTDLDWAGQTVEGPDHHSAHARTANEAMDLANESD